MAKGSDPVISARRRPRQARSTQLVDDILEAALRVLMRDGAARFTTVRVADEAGVSVGSLYQYFPNKSALLFKLQANEWLETWEAVEAILEDGARAPKERLVRAVIAFFRSERQEAALRDALDRAGAAFRESEEAKALHARAEETMRAFVGEVAPNASADARELAADVILTSMGASAEEITTEGRGRAAIDAWARECAEMYWRYLSGV